MMLFGQKLVLLLGLNGFMGISAELLVGDKTILFDEFKATETISHIEDVFVSRISSRNMENPIRLGYVGILVYMYITYVKLYRY